MFSELLPAIAQAVTLALPGSVPREAAALELLHTHAQFSDEVYLVPLSESADSNLTLHRLTQQITCQVAVAFWSRNVNDRYAAAALPGLFARRQVLMEALTGLRTSSSIGHLAFVRGGLIKAPPEGLLWADRYQTLFYRTGP